VLAQPSFSMATHGLNCSFAILRGLEGASWDTAAGVVAQEVAFRTKAGGEPTALGNFGQFFG
jgi:hypothetical protein